MNTRVLVSLAGVLALSLVALNTLGCAGSHNTRLYSDLENRASFDLSCPKQSLQMTELSRSGRIVNSYGVVGCGKRATYVLNMQGNGTWVMNSGGESEAGMGNPPPQQWEQ